MDHRNTFEAVDRSLKDIMRFNDVHSHEKSFGGVTVLLSGDFRQTLPVVLKGQREDVVQASINKSPIWKSCQVLVLIENMRIKDSTSFTEWVLALGDGNLPTVSLDSEEDSCWIIIPDDLLIPNFADPVTSIVSSTYPDLINKYKNPEYLRNRGILTLTNQIVDEINSYVLNVILGEITTYLSSDSIRKASGKVFDQDMMFPVEFLNSLKFPGLPNHELHLKIGIPIILLRNINPSADLCNGTRLIVIPLAPLICIPGGSGDELWFALGKTKVRFGKRELCICTGLKFDRLSDIPSREYEAVPGGIHTRYFQGRKKVVIADLKAPFIWRVSNGLTMHLSWHCFCLPTGSSSVKTIGTRWRTGCSRWWGMFKHSTTLPGVTTFSR
ncbi:hypothetical protein LWI28_000636 [Acer negundo]|uniref:ATP-dependent DNA helicase n=1 Tax=Acer negundo TaxID=4023 RepID=A0AAD5JIC7_ACENE|nr:hypothetical protein LWI28_000636 [Acer negundo]